VLITSKVASIYAFAKAVSILTSFFRPFNKGYKYDKLIFAIGGMWISFCVGFFCRFIKNYDEK